MKRAWESRTVWFAVIQGVVGVLAVLITEVPEWAGVLMVMKSVLDVALRYDTYEPIK